ncbi:DUF2842 domain-containing protein [Xinfangfangia sp. CPCC 101601]|uniref:DUF2842 domain-containing protein n=1 Tax=Pseudogemmobacter lacusdianii TaxID=3069608 RepID=A0ABU0VW70_9RHOB|nr:DUF2842 domain-containing protein [Xinfangfangia sp. CPCC 101601]MDQ2065758.1 DUF2842 domain-containing protein [Xinfangfangia sp. CPCC 101601]
MALRYKTRKRLALLILLVGMPLYIVAAVSLMNWLGSSFGRLPIWAELVVYVGLGLIWILPFRKIFTGIGQADPDEASKE